MDSSCCRYCRWYKVGMCGRWEICLISYLHCCFKCCFDCVTVGSMQWECKEKWVVTLLPWLILYWLVVSWVWAACQCVHSSPFRMWVKKTYLLLQFMFFNGLNRKEGNLVWTLSAAFEMTWHLKFLPLARCWSKVTTAYRHLHSLRCCAEQTQNKNKTIQRYDDAINYACFCLSVCDKPRQLIHH